MIGSLTIVIPASTALAPGTEAMTVQTYIPGDWKAGVANWFVLWGVPSPKSQSNVGEALLLVTAGIAVNATGH